VGALRENDNKVFYVDKEKSDEILLYNFDLQPGDIIEGQIFRNDTVRAIDTLLDNRRVFYLSDNHWQQFILEGIGSDKGLLEDKNELSTLICFMKNKAAVYHDNTGSECLLQLNSVSFSDCDIMKILPTNPGADDQINLSSRLCYEVSYNNPVLPVLTNEVLRNDDNTLTLELYYNYDDQNNADSLKILIPLFDTVLLGYFEEGDYYIDIFVHTIHHHDDQIDTTFYDKVQYIWFTISGPGTVFPEQSREAQCKVYPIPSKDYIIIENTEENNKIRRIELYTILGLKTEDRILGNESDGYLTRMDVSKLTKGLYLLKVYCDKYSFTKKIIVE